MRWPRVALSGFAAVALAGSMSGCYVIQNVAETQSGVGPLTVTLTLCDSADDAQNGDPQCSELGNPDPTANNGDGGEGSNPSSDQLLVGFRVPTATKEPPQIVTAEVPQVPFLRSVSYAAALQALKPAPAGQRWIGYKATAPLAAAQPYPNRYTITVRFPQPVSPFLYRPVIGARAAQHSTAGGPTRPVNCSETDTFDVDPNDAMPPTQAKTTVCIDSPSAAAGGVNSNRTVNTRSVDVLSGKPFTIAAGKTTKPGFQIRALGPAGWGSFTLSAGTDVPGARPTVTPATFAPIAAGRTSVKVRLPVPAKAPEGSYTLTLTAVSGTEARVGTRTFVVGKGLAPAAFRLKLRVARKLDAKRRLRVRASCPASAFAGCAGTLVAGSDSRVLVGTGRARRKLAFGKTAFKIAPGKTKTLRIKAPRRSVAVLRTVGRAKAVLTVKVAGKATQRLRYTARPRAVKR